MTRTHLPNRRTHEVFKFEHLGLHYIVGLGRRNFTAPISEVFINCGKAGTQAQTLARDSAVLLSLALQHGTPIETMRGAVTRNADGSPSGPIGALLDIMAKENGDEASQGESRLPDHPRTGSDVVELAAGESVLAGSD